MYPKQWMQSISPWLVQSTVKNSFLNNYSENFLVKHIVSIFSLIRKSWFTSNEIIVRLLAWHTKFEKRKELKKKICEELVLIAWYLKSWWNFVCQKMRKKVMFLMYTIWKN